MTCAAPLPQRRVLFLGPTPLALPYLEDSRLNSSRYRASGVAAAMVATAAITVPHAANAQQSYRNISNQRFRAVGNGPQSGIIVDVKDAKDAAGVRRAVDSKVRATMRVHTALLDREIALMRQRHILKPGHELPLVQMVHLRQNGRLVSVANNRERTRDVPASNELTFSQPTGFNTTDNTSTSYTTYQAILAFMQSQNGQPALYQELKKILGQPFSSSNVVIRNLDPDDPSKNISVRGVIIEPPTAADSNIYIDFPSFHSSQDVFLGLAQALTQAFYVKGAGGPNSFGFDVYTQGIARAAACIAGQDFTANGFFGSLGTIGIIDPVPSFYYTPYYDLLNQPALGNNTFFPPTPSGQTLGGLAGMLVPRLQMASTAWTKCYIEDPQFFVKFNNMYYDAVTADSTVANNAGRLRDIAAAALPNVEGTAVPDLVRTAVHFRYQCHSRSQTVCQCPAYTTGLDHRCRRVRFFGLLRDDNKWRRKGAQWRRKSRLLRLYLCQSPDTVKWKRAGTDQQWLRTGIAVLYRDWRSIAR